MAATRFPIVFEPEDSGMISAYVVGLPVYAQGATRTYVERAIRHTLAPSPYPPPHIHAPCFATGSTGRGQEGAHHAGSALGARCCGGRPSPHPQPPDGNPKAPGLLHMFVGQDFAGIAGARAL